MNEYISKDKIIQDIEEEIGISNMALDEDVWFDRGLKTALSYIKKIPAADVQPVKHGKWDFRGYQLFKCTNCKEIFTQNQLEAMQNHIDQEEFTFPNFCPNCGAKMTE